MSRKSPTTVRPISVFAELPTSSDISPEPSLKIASAAPQKRARSSRFTSARGSDMGIFPAVPSTPIYVTGLMREAMKHTLHARPDSGVVIWTGPTRIGKTTTARHLMQLINDAYSPGEATAFRCAYAEVGITPRFKELRSMKQGIRSLHATILGPLDDRIYHRELAQELVQRVVEGARLTQVGMVFIDEAGCLGIDEIRGMVAVRNAAEVAGWPLSIVFIGMDNLPGVLHDNPHVEGRIHSWCYFEPYDIDTTWAFLAAVSTHFRSLKRRDIDHEAQVAFVHETYRGVIGRMIPLVRRVDLRASENPSDEVDLLFVQAVHTELRLARDQAVRAAQIGFVPPKPSDGLVTNLRPEIGDGAAHRDTHADVYTDEQATSQSTVRARAAHRQRRPAQGNTASTRPSNSGNKANIAVLPVVSDVFETVIHG